MLLLWVIPVRYPVAEFCVRTKWPILGVKVEFLAVESCDCARADQVVPSRVSCTDGWEVLHLTGFTNVFRIQPRSTSIYVVGIFQRKSSVPLKNVRTIL